MAFQWASVDDTNRVAVIDDSSTLQAFLHPLRQCIVSALDRPLSVAEVAAALGDTTTRLYYHVRLLERLGLIEVVDRRQVGSNQERLYQRAADRYEIASALTGDAYRLSSRGAGVAQSLPGLAAEFGDYLRRAERDLAQQFDNEGRLPEGRAFPFLSVAPGRLSDERADELGRRLQDLANEYFSDPTTDDDAKARRFALLMVFTPAESDEER